MNIKLCIFLKTISTFYARTFEEASKPRRQWRPPKSRNMLQFPPLILRIKTRSPHLIIEINISDTMVILVYRISQGLEATAS